MSYRYIHDEANSVVYRVPKVPEVIENKRKGKIYSWTLHCVVDVTRADNIQERHGWRYQVRMHLRQYYDSSYSKEDAISYFLGHTPPGTEIDEDTYNVLRQKYYNLAISNKQ